MQDKVHRGKLVRLQPYPPFSLQRIIFLTRFNENERLVTSHLDAILSEAVEAETLYGLALVKVYE